MYEIEDTAYNKTNMTIPRLISLCAVVVVLCAISKEAYALTLTPVRLEMSGDPGQTIVGEISLYNEQSDIKTFYTTFENFEPGGDEDGSPKFVGGGSGLATWITSEQSVTLNPNEKRTIPFTITIPSDTEPGGYFGAVFYGGQNPETLTDGEVSVGGKLGTLILLTVKGDIEENAGILDFILAQGRVLTSLPAVFSYRMSNSGGDRIVPVGDISITNTFGMHVTTLPVNDHEGSILPQSARRFSVTWGTEAEGDGFLAMIRHEWNNLHIGWYTAHARIVWGAEGTVSTARYDFLMVPWQLLILSALCVGVALIGIKRYNTWIVSRAQSKK